MASKRTNYDLKTKDIVVALVQSRKRSVKEVAKEYGIQPQQVLSWIGDKVLRDGEGPKEQRAPTPDIPAVPVGLPPHHINDMDLSSSIDPSVSRAIGEWWIRVRLPQELAKAGGDLPDVLFPQPRRGG